VSKKSDVDKALEALTVERDALQRAIDALERGKRLLQPPRKRKSKLAVVPEKVGA
jgi:hypothetical protein